MSSNRIYAVSQKHATQPGLVRLIRASTQAQALRHVAKDTLNVTVASQDHLVYCLTNGIAVEDASVETETLTQPQL